MNVHPSSHLLGSALVLYASDGLSEWMSQCVADILLRRYSTYVVHNLPLLELH